MKAKSKSKPESLERCRQRKISDADLKRLARRLGTTITELRTYRALFPADFERLKRAA